MKTRLVSLVRLLPALVALAVLSSCVVVDDPYYSGTYSRPYDTYSSDYYYAPGYRPSYYSSIGYHYYSGGRYYRTCPSCHSHPCRCSHRSSNVRWLSHDRDWDRSHGRSDRDRDNDRRGNDMKLVRYRQDDHSNLPRGYHSADWYKKRGYSLKQNTYVQRDGDVRGRKPSSSSSSSRRDNDRGGRDDRKKKH